MAFGPPNSVAIAAPIPTDYFGSYSGVAAAVQTQHTQHYHIQPIVPTTLERLINGPVSVLNPATVVPKLPGVAPVPPGAFQIPFASRTREFISRFDYTNPLSWWRRQLGR